MKKSFITLLAIVLATLSFTACENDDQYTIDDFTRVDTVFIAYNGTSVSISGDSKHYVSASGAHVTINSLAGNRMVFCLSGTTSDGSLLVYSQKKYTLVLNSVSITNPSGPAINNQCGKWLYVVCPEGTESTLTDGTAYAESSISQKGTFFSEGQVDFSGYGQLTVNANTRNAIASDDYITVSPGIMLYVNVAATATGHGLKAKDGVFINGGYININTQADGSRGIKSDARTEINGGTTTIVTTGNCIIEDVETVVDGQAVTVKDTTSCAGIKSDSLMTMSGGIVTILSTGDGGKGINCSLDFRQTGGMLNITTSGSNNVGAPKGIKSDTSILLSGGSFESQTTKSRACDNAGTDYPTIADGASPTKEYWEKRHIKVVF